MKKGEGSPYLSDFFQRTVPQQNVYCSKKYRTIYRFDFGVFLERNDRVLKDNNVEVEVTKTNDRDLQLTKGCLHRQSNI